MGELRWVYLFGSPGGPLCQRLYELGLVPSMGTVGDCYDPMESFWGSMRNELLNRQRLVDLGSHNKNQKLTSDHNTL